MGRYKPPRKRKPRAASKVKASKHAEPRRLYLKFRVKPLVRMPKSVMFAKLREFVHTGIAPDDLEVAYMSYDRTVGKQFKPGARIAPGEQEELEKFYSVLIAMGKESMEYVRLERPAD